MSQVHDVKNLWKRVTSPGKLSTIIYHWQDQSRSMKNPTHHFLIYLNQLQIHLTELEVDLLASKLLVDGSKSFDLQCWWKNQNLFLSIESYELNSVSGLLRVTNHKIMIKIIIIIKGYYIIEKELSKNILVLLCPSIQTLSPTNSPYAQCWSAGPCQDEL